MRTKEASMGTEKACISTEEVEWISNMKRLIRWALKKGFEYDYPFPMSTDDLGENLARLTKSTFYHLLSIGEIEHYE